MVFAWVRQQREYEGGFMPISLEEDHGYLRKTDVNSSFIRVAQSHVWARFLL